MEMNSERKAELVAALRSGDYTQGFQNLTVIDSEGVRRDCCLGVASDLAMKAGVVPESLVSDSKVPVSFLEEADVRYYDGNSRTLCPVVSEWLGLGFPPDNPYAEYPTGLQSAIGERTFSLAGLNDYGFTFAQIADVIDYFF